MSRERENLERNRASSGPVVPNFSEVNTSPQICMSIDIKFMNFFKKDLSWGMRGDFKIFVKVEPDLQ